MDRDGGNKRQILYRYCFITPCQNFSLTMGSRIYGERKTQILLSSTTTIDPLAQDLT